MSGRYAALVLAAQRGSGDPLAPLSPEGHKCLLPIGGRAMIERVLAALMAARDIASIAVSIDRPDVLDQLPGFRELKDSGRILVLKSEATPATSVLGAIDALGQNFPFLVTTADHALLTPGMLNGFCRKGSESDASVLAGLVHKKVIEEAVPGAKRTYLTFKDGGYSGANLFLFKDRRSLAAVEFWRRVEQDRKKPWRIARAFGPFLLLAYLLRLKTLDEVMRLVSDRLGAKAQAVLLDQAEAAVDVDKPDDIAVAEALLARRGH